MRNDDSYPSRITTSDNLAEGMDSSANPSTNQVVVDPDDEIEVMKMVKGVRKQVCDKLNYIPKSEKRPCEGILVSFPEGMNEHTSIHLPCIASTPYPGTTDLTMTSSTFKRRHVRKYRRQQVAHAKIVRNSPQVHSTPRSCQGSGSAPMRTPLSCTMDLEG